MNYIRHLSGFFEKVAKDKVLNPTHVSLYVSLFQFWNRSRFVNPISITREEIMRISKISSFTTYHRCLKALHEQGYIKYEPSFNPYKGSHVYLFNFSDELKPLKSDKTASSFFEQDNGQVLGKQCTSTDTGTVQVDGQVVESYINNTNTTNNLNDSNSLNLRERAKKNENESDNFLKVDAQEKEKSSAKKEKEEEPPSEQETAEYLRNLFSNQNSKPPESNSQTPLPNPTIEEVLQYFREQNYPEVEANKFFNYFKSIGWLVGGKTPMTDWPAAARNWMLNAPKYISNERTDRIKSFDTSADKDYSEPL